MGSLQASAAKVLGSKIGSMPDPPDYVTASCSFHTSFACNVSSLSPCKIPMDPLHQSFSNPLAKAARQHARPPAYARDSEPNGAMTKERRLQELQATDVNLYEQRLGHGHGVWVLWACNDCSSSLAGSEQFCMPPPPPLPPPPPPAPPQPATWALNSSNWYAALLDSHDHID